MQKDAALKKLHMVGTRKSHLDLARGRLVLVSAFFAVFYIVILARVVDLNLIQGEFSYHSEVSLQQTAISQDGKSRRADIVDRNGVLLARSISSASLYADPVMVQNPAEVAVDLARLFPDLNKTRLLKNLKSKKRFVWIKRNITPKEQNEVLYLGYPGLGFKTEDRRVYPHGSMASHVVGATSVDGQGLSGIEVSYNDGLAQTENPLSLTIDVRLQHALQRELQSTIESFSAKAATGLILDVHSGEVLAAVSLPDFNPHEYAKTSVEEKFNRFSLGVYELGSTFKIFSTAAFLEEKKLGIDETFDVRDPIKIGRFVIEDYHPENRILSAPEVFIHSSNIGSALMVREIGGDKLQDFYQSLGLLDKAAFDLTEVGAPLVPQRWREVNALTASYGHGIAVSPLQLIAAAATIVNGGHTVKPHLVMSRSGEGDAGEHDNLPVRFQVVSEETSQQMRQLLRLAVMHGTGTNADVPGYSVGGKTGTAEKSSASGYARNKLLSSFLGFFPMADPQYAIYVMVDEPKGNKKSFGYATGGWVAAPTFKRVAESMVSILGLSPLVSSKEDEVAVNLVSYLQKDDKNLEGDLESN